MVVDIYNRLIRGHITSVDINKNTCTVLSADKSGEYECYLSHPFISSTSGIRFAPRGGETVLVSFSAIGVPTIVGFILEQQKIEAQRANKDKVFFRELKSNELVIYGGATGDSEIYIDQNGNIQIGAGVSVLNLDPFRRTIDFITGSLRGSTLNGVNVDMGNVIREIAGQTQVIPETVEFRAHVETKDLSVVDVKFGNVITDSGIPDVSSRALPKVFSLVTYAGIVKLGEIYVDQGGLIEVTSTNQLSIDAPLIQLGGNLALSSLVKGEVLNSQLTEIINILIEALGALKPKEGFESVPATLITQLTTLLGQIPLNLSSSVKVK